MSVTFVKFDQPTRTAAIRIDLDIAAILARLPTFGGTAAEKKAWAAGLAYEQAIGELADALAAHRATDADLDAAVAAKQAEAARIKASRAAVP